jgi:hypothetical protein
MTKKAGLSQTAVSRIWRAFELKPHREQTWMVLADPQLIEMVRDVVGGHCLVGPRSPREDEHDNGGIRRDVSNPGQQQASRAQPDHT